jgi:hypothetical protein
VEIVDRKFVREEVLSGNTPGKGKEQKQVGRGRTRAAEGSAAERPSKF